MEDITREPTSPPLWQEGELETPAEEQEEEGVRNLMMTTVMMRATTMATLARHPYEDNQHPDQRTQTKVSPQGYPPQTNSTHPRC